jgi:hypothetical protein
MSMFVKPQVFGTMCRIMDINYYQKQHEKIRQQFRHDNIMRKLKQREDREFRNMFIKVVLILIIFVLIIYIISK